MLLILEGNDLDSVGEYFQKEPLGFQRVFPCEAIKILYNQRRSHRYRLALVPSQGLKKNPEFSNLEICSLVGGKSIVNELFFQLVSVEFTVSLRCLNLALFAVSKSLLAR